MSAHDARNGRHNEVPLQMNRATRQKLNTLLQRAEQAGLVVPAVALLACMVFIWGLAEVADEVKEGESAAFDQWTLRLLRDPADLANPRGPAWLQQAAVELTTLGGTPVLSVVVIVGVGYLLVRRSFVAAAALAIAVVGGRLLSALLKTGFARPRPDVVPHFTEVHTLSFPSGHAMMSAVVWLVLGAMLAQAHSTRRIKVYFIAAAASVTMVIGLTRIYLGVHYPTDVLAGWAAGAAWASLWWAGVAWWAHRRLAQGEAPRQLKAPAAD